MTGPVGERGGPGGGHTGASGPGTDRIVLTGLRARGRHGVYDFERAQGQDFVVDVVLELDLTTAGRSDDVADTVHYGELAERLVAIVTGEPVNLIETLAERLAAACLADPRVLVSTVTVHKPQAPIPHDFADVAVTVTRRR
ncbi:dihydroneopterin aldolase [Plantactinospora mayteni]|uniref:7,8-dihydroneopterin aldolase n=1 Tax=Plantactinospora mayteni TaxID=566021 RepID=A0ABQ4ENC5_9ACTN|nr:dihydroneopterin aldolase [Plantactinospora mayteni]GIG96144.1 dihydroneopterin aldolase [Plantactinospora mayteni]